MRSWTKELPSGVSLTNESGVYLCSITKYSEMTWLDLFLWGYIKDRVCNAIPTTPGALKAKIAQVSCDIPEIVPRKVTKNVITHCQYCIAVDGGLFEHLF